MRIQSILTVFTLAAFVAGSLLILAFWQTSQQLTWLLLITAAAVGGLTSGWGFLKLRFGIQALLETDRMGSRQYYIDGSR